jgi:hypothetical protein
MKFLRGSQGSNVRCPGRGRLLLFAFTPHNTQACGEQQIVCLQADRRVADVAVAEGGLPAEPFLHLRADRRIGLEAVVSGWGEIRIAILRLVVEGQ